MLATSTRLAECRENSWFVISQSRIVLDPDIGPCWFKEMVQALLALQIPRGTTRYRVRFYRYATHGDLMQEMKTSTPCGTDVKIKFTLPFRRCAAVSELIQRSLTLRCSSTPRYRQALEAVAGADSPPLQPVSRQKARLCPLCIRPWGVERANVVT